MATVKFSEILVSALAVLSAIYFLRPKQKKTIIVCCCCILVFAFLSLNFTNTFARVKEKVQITALNEKCQESKGTEIDISNLYIDGDVFKSYNVVQGHWYQISDRYSWRPQEDTRWDGTATNSIIIQVPVGWSRSFRFQGNLWRGYVSVKKPNGEEEIINTYSDNIHIYTCEIGRSSTKLLLLQGIIKIICYTITLTVLTGFFIYIMQNEKIIELYRKVSPPKKVQGPHQRIWLKALMLTVGFGILITIFAVSNLRDRIKTDAIVLAPGTPKESVPIVNHEPLVQTFKANGTFNEIRLKFCIYGNETESSVNITLTDDTTNEVFGGWDITNHSVDTEIMKLKLEREAGKGSYRLDIKGKNPNEETDIGIYLQDNSSYGGNLSIAGNEQKKVLYLGLCAETNVAIFFLIVVLSLAIFCTFVAYAVLFIYKLDLWKISFILMMGFGVVYIVIFPAGCINDSWRHYVTAYQLSNEILGIEKSQTGTIMMRKDDRNEFLRYRSLDRVTSISTYYEECDEFSLHCRDDALTDCGEVSLIGRGNAASSVAYFPQTFGLTLGRLLSFGTIPCMFLARLCQLTVVTILVSAAVAIIPYKKDVLLLIALLPIFQQQVTAFSYDGIAFGFAFLFIALCTKFNTMSEKPPEAILAIFLIVTIGLCACRGGMYIFLLFLLLLVPNSVLSKRTKLFVWGLGLFAVFTFFGISYASSSASARNASNLVYGSPFQHPVSVGLHVISSVIEGIDSYWAGSFGSRMGWSELIVPYFITFGFTIMLLLASLSNHTEKEMIDIKGRIICLTTIFLVVGFCFGTMYIAEGHRATQWYIWGVQGRYFIPVMPLLFFQVQNRVIVLKKNIKSMIIYSFCLLEVIEIFYLMRTFVIR